MGRALENKPAAAGVEAFVVFADDHEIDVLGSLVLERAESFVVQLHGTEIDVLFHLEPQPQQNPLFQDAGFHVGMADGAEQNRGKLSQFIRRAVGQHFLRAEVTVAAEIVIGVIEFDAELLRGGIENLDGFPDHFRPGAVAADDCDVVTLHGLPFGCVLIVKQRDGIVG